MHLERSAERAKVSKTFGKTPHSHAPSLAKIVAVYNSKGGVGKTSSSVNLAYELSTSGSKVLVWDLDPQAATSFYFRVKPRVKGGSKKLLSRKSAAVDAVKATDYENLDLLPADFTYRKFDIRLHDGKRPKSRLRKVMEPLLEEYDYIVVDCSPGIGLVSENVFRMTDLLLVPVIPTTLSLRTLEQVRHFLAKEGLTPRLIPFFSMADRRKKLHRKILASPPQFKDVEWGAVIPSSSDIELMGVHRAPLQTYVSTRSQAAQAVARLAHQVANGLDAK